MGVTERAVRFALRPLQAASKSASALSTIPASVGRKRPSISLGLNTKQISEPNLTYARLITKPQRRHLKTFFRIIKNQPKSPLTKDATAKKRPKPMVTPATAPFWSSGGVKAAVAMNVTTIIKPTRIPKTEGIRIMNPIA